MPKLKRAQEIEIDLSEGKVFKAFSDSQRKSTLNAYTSYLRRLKGFTSESGAEILAERMAVVHRIFQFQHYLEEKGCAR